MDKKAYVVVGMSYDYCDTHGHGYYATNQFEGSPMFFRVICSAENERALFHQDYLTESEAENAGLLWLAGGGIMGNISLFFTPEVWESHFDVEIPHSVGVWGYHESDDPAERGWRPYCLLTAARDPEITTYVLATDSGCPPADFQSDGYAVPVSFSRHIPRE